MLLAAIVVPHASIAQGRAAAAPSAAKLGFAVDRLAAGNAQRRQRDVERKPRGLSACAMNRAKRVAQMARNGTG